MHLLCLVALRLNPVDGAAFRALSDVDGVFRAAGFVCQPPPPHAVTWAPSRLCKWFVGLTACTHWDSPPAPSCTSEGLTEAPVCSARSAVFEGHKRVCAAL